MKPVERREILDYATYEDTRNEFRALVLKEKAYRRVHLGDYLTLLFENHLTVRYQIQEMIRAERTVREADILHEIATYNELLGKNGELGCTLLIEIEDPVLRDQKLSEWWDLPEKLYVLLPDGTRVHATLDERQRGDGRLSSVQYLKFDTRGQTPTAVGVELPGFKAVEGLSEGSKQALRSDLSTG